jgi:hypothetical protein
VEEEVLTAVNLLPHHPGMTYEDDIINGGEKKKGRPFYVQS